MFEIIGKVNKDENLIFDHVEVVLRILMESLEYEEKDIADVMKMVEVKSGFEMLNL